MTSDGELNAAKDDRTFMQGVRMQSFASMAVRKDQNITSTGSHVTSYL